VLSADGENPQPQTTPRKQPEIAQETKAPAKTAPPKKSQTTPTLKATEKPALAEPTAELHPENVAESTIDKDSDQDIAYIRKHWKEFIKSLHGEGSSGNLDAFLRSACEPVAIEDSTIVLGFYYTFHKEKIEDNKYRHLVERKLKEVFGKPYKVRCIIYERKRKDHLVKAAKETMGAKVIDETEGEENE